MKFSVCPFTANIFSSGKPTRALDTLYDVIKSKKRNNNYSEKLIEQVCVMCIVRFTCIAQTSRWICMRGWL